jgi:hypothetical protein
MRTGTFKLGILQTWYFGGLLNISAVRPGVIPWCGVGGLSGGVI